MSCGKLPPKGSFSGSVYASPGKTRQNKTESLDPAEVLERSTIISKESKKDEIKYINWVNKLLEENNMKTLGSSPSTKKIFKLIVNLLAENKVLKDTLTERSHFEDDEDGRVSYIKSLEDQIACIKKQLNEYHEISLNQVENDRKALNSIQEAMEANSEEEIFTKIETFKNIAKVGTSLEIFVQEICREVVPELVEDEEYQSFAVGLKEVFPRIKALKGAIEELTEFKIKIYKSLRVPISSPEEELIEKAQSISYFEKLFEVDPSEDIFDVMEKLYLYYREAKSILEKLKSKLKLNSQLSGFFLIDELKRMM